MNNPTEKGQVVNFPGEDFFYVVAEFYPKREGIDLFPKVDVVPLNWKGAFPPINTFNAEEMEVCNG